MDKKQAKLDACNRIMAKTAIEIAATLNIGLDEAEGIRGQAARHLMMAAASKDRIQLKKDLFTLRTF